MSNTETPRDVAAERGVMQHLARLLELEGMCIMRADRAEWWELNREREAACKTVRDAIMCAERYRAALQQIIDTVPATDGQGGFFVEHCDQDGNPVGIQPIDPMAVVGEMMGIAVRATTAAGAA